MASFVLTAGYTHSLPVVLIGEGILRAGHRVDMVLVVSPWQLDRLFRVIDQRGLGWLRKRVGLGKGFNTGPSRIESFASEMGIQSSKIKAWASRHGVPVKNFKDLNSPGVVAQLERLAPDAVVYGGGGILRGPFIRAAGVTLNAHSGPLPEIRGMNAAEWTFLLKARREITIHHIDEGIDTGAPVSSRVIDEEATGIDDLRDLAVLSGVKEMIAVISEDRWRNAYPVIGAAPSRQCFVMADAIREILNRRLANCL